MRIPEVPDTYRPRLTRVAYSDTGYARFLPTVVSGRAVVGHVDIFDRTRQAPLGLETPQRLTAVELAPRIYDAILHGAPWAGPLDPADTA